MRVDYLNERLRPSQHGRRAIFLYEIRYLHNSQHSMSAQHLNLLLCFRRVVKN
jgi:hypothetical protein